MTVKLPKPAVRWTLTPKGVYIERPVGNCYVNAMHAEDNRLIAKAPALCQILQRGLDCGLFDDAPVYRQDVVAVLKGLADLTNLADFAPRKD